jgi:hypothetical protein
MDVCGVIASSFELKHEGDGSGRQQSPWFAYRLPLPHRKRTIDAFLYWRWKQDFVEQLVIL